MCVAASDEMVAAQLASLKEEARGQAAREVLEEARLQVRGGCGGCRGARRRRGKKGKGFGGCEAREVMGEARLQVWELASGRSEEWRAGGEGDAGAGKAAGEGRRGRRRGREEARGQAARGVLKEARLQVGRGWV